MIQDPKPPRKKRAILDSLLRDPLSDTWSDEEVLRRVQEIAAQERAPAPPPTVAPVYAAPPADRVAPLTPRPIMEVPRSNQLSENLRQMARSFTTAPDMAEDVPFLPAPVHTNALPPRPSAAGLEATPLSKRLRPEPDPNAPPPIYTAPRPTKESFAPSSFDSYRMPTLEVGPEDVTTSKPMGAIESKLRRAPYERTTRESPFVDLAKIQAADAKLGARLASPDLTPEDRADLQAVRTNLQQQMELGRRFGMGGVGASKAAQFGLQAYDAATLGWSGAEYQKELAKRYEDGTFISPQDVEAVLGEPLASSTTPVPGGAGVAGQFVAGAATFMGGERLLGKATQALAGSRFKALARPAEAYFDLAYRPIQPRTSALGYALKRGVQGAFQGAPVGVGIDAIRAVNEGRPISEGIIEGGRAGAMIGGLMEAALPFHLGGAGAPVRFAQAAAQPFNRGFHPELRTMTDDTYRPGRDPQYAGAPRVAEGYMPGMDPQYAGRDIRPDVAEGTRPYPERVDAEDRPLAEEMPGVVEEDLTPGQRETRQRIETMEDPLEESLRAREGEDPEHTSYRERMLLREQAAAMQPALPPEVYRGPERRMQIPSVSADDILNRHRRATDEQPAGAARGYAGAEVLGGMAAGGAVSLAAAGLLPEDTDPETRALVGVAAFTAGLVGGGVGGAMLARSFGRGGERRMAFPRLPERRPSFLANERGGVGTPEEAPRYQPGEVIQGGLQKDDAVALSRDLKFQEVPHQMRRTSDGTFEVVAKGKPQEQKPGTAVATRDAMAMTAPTEDVPYTPGAPPHENRPTRGSKGFKLEVDPQGRYFSRLGRHLESIDAKEAMTADVWLKRLNNSQEFSNTEYDAVLKPVLEKIAQGDPAATVFPWLQGRMDMIGSPDINAHIPPETWADRRFTATDLLSLAENNRIRLTTERRVGGQAPPDPRLRIRESWNQDPYGFMREHTAYEESGRGDPSNHPAWESHVQRLETEQDDASEAVDQARTDLAGTLAPNGYGGYDAVDGLPSPEYGDYEAGPNNSRYQDSRNTLVERMDERNSELQTEFEQSVYEELRRDLRRDSSVRTSDDANAIIGGDIFPDGLEARYDPETTRWEIVDAEGEHQVEGVQVNRRATLGTISST